MALQRSDIAYPPGDMALQDSDITTQGDDMPILEGDMALQPVVKRVVAPPWLGYSRRNLVARPHEY